MPALGFGARLALASGAGRVFDFSGGAMPPGATLSRASMGTRWDGGVVVAAADTARFDLEGGGGVRGLLVEAAAGNSWIQSTNVAAWDNIGTTGSTTSELVEDASDGVHYRQAAAAMTAGVSYTLSGIVGEVAGSAPRSLRVRVAGAIAPAQDFAVDPATGAVTATTGFSAIGAMPLAANAWLWWATLTATATTPGASLRLYLNSAFGTTSATRPGDGVSRLRVGHCQCEAGPLATSRIVTGAAAGTRAADALVLDWRGRGVGDGEHPVFYGFDDGSGQAGMVTVAGGLAGVPVPLARTRLRRVTLG